MSQIGILLRPFSWLCASDHGDNQPQKRLLCLLNTKSQATRPWTSEVEWQNSSVRGCLTCVACDLQATPLFSVLLEKALQLIENCSCKPASGCPGCVQHTDCGEYNAVLNKFSAIIVLQCTIEAEEEHRKRLRLQQQIHI